MEEFVEKDSFEFGNNLNEEEGNFEVGEKINIEESKFEYNNASGLNEGYNENDGFFSPNNNQDYQQVEQVAENSDFSLEVPIENNSFNPSFDSASNKGDIIEDNDDEFNSNFAFSDSDEDNVFEEQPINNYEDINVDMKNEEVLDEQTNENTVPINVFDETTLEDSNLPFETTNEFENIDNELNQSLETEDMNNVITTEKIDEEFLEKDPETFANSMNDNFVFDVVEPTVEPILEEKVVKSTNIVSDTPIEELNKLTEYKEEKISATDIKALFNRVGTNVQEASDIFIKNTEMKEKIDAKFEELKELQAKVENAKKNQYDEINAYKEEVFGKLTEKKNEVEERINKLKEFQDNLEREKEEFEKYKKEQTDEIERVQKEVQDAYESRREELSHIEDVLRKQKDSLDEERNQLSLDKIQYEADKNELANNLLKFNQIVDSFTIGMESAGKEE